MNGKLWTPAEDETLRGLYQRKVSTAKRWQTLRAALPGRTRHAIIARAAHLSVQRKTEWTADEDALLVREWGVLSPRSLRAKLPGRTWVAIRWRAGHVLRLPLGVPQGHVTIREAARRTGYACGTLRVLLARHGVEERVYYGEREHGAARRWRAIPWDAVREAVEADLESEVPYAAALARGLSHASLVRWLKAAGVLPAEGRQGRPVRVPTVDIDRVVAARLGAVEGSAGVTRRAA